MKNNKCKVLVYPFDMEFLSNARYLNEFDKIEVKYFLSPKGWKESVEKLLEVNKQI